MWPFKKQQGELELSRCNRRKSEYEREREHDEKMAQLDRLIAIQKKRLELEIAQQNANAKGGNNG